MFTGIIRELGTITDREETPDGLILTIASPLAATLQGGDSVAVNGACLTALAVAPDSWTVRLMQETIARTNLGTLAPNQRVNLERPVQAGQAFDGHFVLGHVDDVSTVTARTDREGDVMYTFRPPARLLPYLIPQGSIALDGVSLTIVAIADDQFTVSMMPYTLAHTTFGDSAAGNLINTEVDMLAKHVARLLQARDAAAPTHEA